MNDFNIDTFINDQKGSNNIDLNDFPELDLYMDQVMQLFETRLAYTKRNPDDKVLTKTMINNYAKDNLLMKIKNKKYTKNHLILMGLIYNLKGALSLTDIKTLLTPIIQSFDSDKELKESSHRIEKNTLNILKNKNKNLGNYEEKLLLACSYVSMSNLFRRMSERIIDECFEDAKEKK